MSKQPNEAVLTGDIYFDQFELDDATKDAIATLAGVHPDLDEYDEEDRDSEAIGRMIFLLNTVQLFHGHKFDETRRTGLADLMSIGEYLMDAVNLATRSDTPSAAARVMATIAASLYTDAMSDPKTAQRDFEEAMAKVNAEAVALLKRCLEAGQRR